MNYRIRFYFFICLGLTACGGIYGESSATTDAPAPATMAEAIKTSDAIGKTPTLNRDDTVSGPDKDGNGVRDDIDAYIDSLPDSTPQKSALKQTSAVILKTLTVDLTSRSAVLEVARQIGASSVCLQSKYDIATASKKRLEMEKLTVNTKLRFEAYAKFSRALSGSTFALPQGDGCEN